MTTIAFVYTTQALKINIMTANILHVHYGTMYIKDKHVGRDMYSNIDCLWM